LKLPEGRAASAWWADARHVIVEIKHNEAKEIGWEAGFYLIRDLDPERPVASSARKRPDAKADRTVAEQVSGSRNVTKSGNEKSQTTSLKHVDGKLPTHAAQRA
jgi:hypothetical protein